MNYPKLDLDVEELYKKFDRREINPQDLSARLRMEFIMRGYSLSEYSVTEDWKRIPESIAVKSEIPLPFEDDVRDITGKLNITVTWDPKENRNWRKKASKGVACDTADLPDREEQLRKHRETLKSV